MVNSGPAPKIIRNTDVFGLNLEYGGIRSVFHSRLYRKASANANYANRDCGAPVCSDGEVRGCAVVKCMDLERAAPYARSPF